MIMAIENRRTEKFGVVHNDTLLDVFDTVDQAKQQVAHYEQTAESIGMRPNHKVVTVTESVTYSKPKLYAEPEPEQPADEQSTDGDAGDQPAS